MNSIEKIDQLFMLMSENRNKLSILLPQLYPIALECQDYIGFCVLFQWEMPLADSKDANLTRMQEASKMLLATGLTESKVDEIEKLAFEKYLSMRSLDNAKNQVSIWSVREMEDYFIRMDEMINALDVPKELHPLDLYYRSEQASAQKLQMIQNRQQVEKQYAIFQNFMTSKLAQYQIILTREERNKELEKRICNSKRIFIIHGHNEAKRRELEAMLRDIFHLEPVVLLYEPNQGMTIIEKFEKYASDCSYAFALFTPDDIVSMKNGEQYLQARPNVIFELGWFYANLGRSRVCITY